MNALDLDPEGYLPLLRLLAAKFKRQPPPQPDARACCA